MRRLEACSSSIPMGTLPLSVSINQQSQRGRPKRCKAHQYSLHPQSGRIPRCRHYTFGPKPPSRYCSPRSRCTSRPSCKSHARIRILPRQYTPCDDQLSLAGQTYRMHLSWSQCRYRSRSARHHKRYSLPDTLPISTKCSILVRGAYYAPLHSAP
jgi:hypothetical protein